MTNTKKHVQYLFSTKLKQNVGIHKLFILLSKKMRFDFCSAFYSIFCLRLMTEYYLLHVEKFLDTLHHSCIHYKHKIRQIRATSLGCTIFFLASLFHDSSRAERPTTQLYSMIIMLEL